jgi:hypothetical protein
VIFETGRKKNIYFPIYPLPTLIHLSHHFTSTSKPVFWLLSQPLPYFRLNFFVISEISATFLNAVLKRFTRQTLPTVNRKHFFMNVFALSYFAHKKCCFSVGCSSSMVAILTTKPASEHAHARLLPRLSWNWTVLLPSDTHRKPITFITAVYFRLWLFTDSLSNYS